MSFSSFDFISPKITLYYNGHNSHISRIGGFLSICLFIIICIIIFYSFWGLIETKYCTSFIYKENVNNKIFQEINYSGINHFIQIYSNRNNGYFGDIDNKNIIIYGIKENNNNIYNNTNLNLDLLNTEHWLYDKCDKIADIDSKLSNIVSNYSLSICIRFYYNPTYKKYFEIGYDGYIGPTLETNDINEKKNSYKIIINKCSNTTFINNYMGYICNPDYEIKKYFNIYKEIFIFFSDNKILPLNHQNHFENYYYSISSTLQQYSYFENNIIFIPTKLIIKKGYIFRTHKDFLSYTFNSYYINEKLNDDENLNLIGIFNLYLDSKINVYEIICANIIDVLSHLGGLVRIIFFIFEILNYINHNYTILEHTKELFKISTGIESSYDSKDINFGNMRYVSTKNYKNKPTITNDDLSRNNFSPIINKKKIKILEPKGFSPKVRYSCKKNNIALYPLNMASNKKNILSKNNTNTFKIRNKDKRKSYLSQGYRVKNKDNNSIYIKNQSYCENEVSNNEVPSSNNNANDNNSNHFNSKENNLKMETSKKSNNEFNSSFRHKKSRKVNIKVPSNKHIVLEKNEGNSHLLLQNPNQNHPIQEQNNMRHKSINYTNQKKLFRNSIFNKNHIIPKNSSEFINDSSKQILVNNKNLLISLNYNRTQFDKNKIDENVRTGLINNTEFANSTKNLNLLVNNNNNNNSNNGIDILALVKSLIKNKLKLEISEPKESSNQNIIGKKIKLFEFFKSLLICKKNYDNKIYLINNFRLKLLSEEHLYRNHINLYLMQKMFQIDESYKFDIKELYNNL